MLSERLKLLREEKELTQQQMAEAIFSTQQKVSNYENGLVEPDFETLVRLADFFDTSADYILGRNRSVSLENAHSARGLAEIFRALPKAAIKD